MHDAAIGKDCGRGKIAGTLAGDEADHTGDLPRARHTLQRYRRIELGELRGIIHRADIDGCCHGAWRHPDNEDVVFGELDARRARQHAHTAFGQAVGGVAGHRPVHVYRADVDNAAATSLLDHLLGRDLGAEKSTFEVDRHDLVILIFGGVEDRGAGFHPGVVHHDVDPTEPAHRLVNERLQVGDFADIGFDANRLITELADLLLQGFGCLRAAYIVDDDVRMQSSKFENDRLADAAVAASDDGDLALQRHYKPPRFPTMRIGTISARRAAAWSSAFSTVPTFLSWSITA